MAWRDGFNAWRIVLRIALVRHSRAPGFAGIHGRLFAQLEIGKVRNKRARE